MVEWLKLGDSNNAFFYRAVKGRIATNSICPLIAGEGNKVTKVEDIKTEAVSCFQGLLGNAITTSASVGELKNPSNSS